MPEFHSVPQPAPASDAAAEEIQFPPVSRDHILYCSYEYWFPKYRKVCIKSRIIPLPAEFIEYLREDSIVLSDETSGAGTGGGDGDYDDDDWEPSNPTMRHFKSAEEAKYDVFLDADDSEDDEDDNAPPVVRLPPNKRFPEVHQRIKDEIAALGGVVAPKLNWSAPKDAAELMEQKNTMRCRTPDDVYFMLKSSNFVSHDLEHAFDGTMPQPAGAVTQQQSGSSLAAASQPSSSSSSSPLGFNPVLVLRAYFDIHTALEFRCFVKQRNLVAITPRDLKYYPYLEGLRSTIVERTKTLFHSKLQFTFPSGNFSFDIYIPEKEGYDVGDNEGEPHNPNGRLSWARLIDINPWAPRTDTLLFGWRELLELKIPKPFLGIMGDSGVADENQGLEGDEDDESAPDFEGGGNNGSEDGDDGADGDEDEDYAPELRLVDKDDPAAMNFSSAPYSAHKLPKEVVDASMAGEGGLREFAQQWQELVQGREQRSQRGDAEQ